MAGKHPSFLKRPHLTTQTLPKKEEKENQFHASIFTITAARSHAGSGTRQFSAPGTASRGRLDTDTNSAT
jgi:hypothetical protein